MQYSPFHQQLLYKVFGGREDWRFSEIIKTSKDGIDFNSAKFWAAEITETEFILQVFI